MGIPVALFNSMKTHPFHIEIPIELWERFKKLAATNRRKLKEEALIAIENHLRVKKDAAVK